MSEVIDLEVFRESRQIIRLDLGRQQVVELIPAQKRKRLQCMDFHGKNFLFPNIEFKEWGELLQIDPIMMPCGCGKKVSVEVPFVIPGGEAAGLMALPCDSLCDDDKIKAVFVKFPEDVKKKYGFHFPHRKNA